MRPVRTSALAVLSLSLAGVAGLAGCGSGSSGSPGAASGSSFATGKTFTMSMSSDPGALDPQLNIASGAFQLSQFAYDPLVSVDDQGQIHSQLASSWNVSGTTVTFQIGSGITCSDGSAFDAKTAADNISFIEDPKNKSPFLGVLVPAGAKATASGSTVTVKLATASPFVLNGFANLPMVCESGLKNRGSLKAQSAGTGPYVLSRATPGTEYTYTLRDGYAWGPDGATTATAGMPASIDVKVVANETTAANELLAGSLNAASVLGPDASRLSGAGLQSQNTPTVVGEQWYNHADGHITSDKAVRVALTQALDLAQLQKVLTSGKGGPATQLAVVPPTGCTGDSVTGNVPATDSAAAAAALASAGWTKGSDGILAKDGKKLSVTFLYDSALGSGGSAAAELVGSTWKALGVDVTTKGETTSQLQSVLFGTGDWDVAWEPINVSTPDQLVPFLSGPGVSGGGTNFAGIDNATYSASVTKAMAQTGAGGCSDWLGGEGALFQSADIIPFANNLVPTFAKGATFQIVGEIVPTSIRMLG
jgi:peptide/nickel transport system substrate-binding protein